MLQPFLVCPPPPMLLLETGMQECFWAVLCREGSWHKQALLPVLCYQEPLRREGASTHAPALSGLAVHKVGRTFLPGHCGGSSCYVAPLKGSCSTLVENH